MTEAQARLLIGIYAEAWKQRDAKRILEVFTEDATYHDPSFGKVSGHAGIRHYWETKVLAAQRNITFELLNLWVHPHEVIAEWHATFGDIQRTLSIDMTEVAIFQVRGEKFCSLREYYRSTKKPLT